MAVDAHRNRQRAEGFGEDAPRYERSRPGYPAALVDDVLDGCDMPARVLDVGCGTGRAACLFMERDCIVIGVEPDARMAAVARSHGVTVDVCTFEAWEPAERHFEVVISAQAWHWIDPATGVPKAAAALGPGGRLALFWNAVRHDAASAAALSPVYQKLAPELADSVVLAPAARPDTHVEPIAASGLFGTPVVSRYTWPQRYTTEQWLDLLGTHSDHRILPPTELEALLDGIGEAIEGLGGFFSVAYDTTLITAVRR
jgi:SAM-dependent methyltransferase